jgi:hypothetical protein
MFFAAFDPKRPLRGFDAAARRDIVARFVAWEPTHLVRDEHALVRASLRGRESIQNWRHAVDLVVRHPVLAELGIKDAVAEVLAELVGVKGEFALFSADSVLVVCGGVGDVVVRLDRTDADVVEPPNHSLVVYLTRIRLYAAQEARNIEARGRSGAAIAVGLWTVAVALLVAAPLWGLRIAP